jgi:Spy/CpxP family protein refolding chaperone
MSIDVNAVSATGGSSSPDPGLSLRPFANLDLSESQRTQIRTILKNAQSQGLAPDAVQSQIAAVLTAAQQAQLQANQAQAASQGGPNGPPNGKPPGNPFTDPNGPFANLGLTSAQQTQIARILQSGHASGASISSVNSQISAVLTAAQQSTFQTDLQHLPAPGSQPPAR